MPQLNYGQQPQWILGQIAQGSEPQIDSYTNEELAQISTLTLAGVTDDAGDYSFSLEGPDGENYSSTYTSAGSQTSDAIAAAWLTDLQADDDLANIAAVTKTGTGVLTFAFIHPGRAYSFTTTVVAGTAVVANTQAAGGVNIPLGVAVEHGSADDFASLLDGSTADADIAGVTTRGLDALVHDYGSNDGLFEPGQTMNVLHEGDVIVYVEDAVTKGAGAFTRIANAVAGKTLGTFRSDADGGDAIAMTGAKYQSSTTGAGLAILRVNRP